MKFFNPFKPHLCELHNGTYAVRKWLFGWEYLAQDNGIYTFPSWLSIDKSVEKNASVYTIEDAYKLFFKITRKRPKPFSKKI